MPTLEARLSDWIPQVQGKYINEDWEPREQGYGAQCWDLHANWAKYIGLPVINTGGPGRWPGWAGNMADAFPQTPAIAAAYEKLPPSATVQAGDTLVWGDSYWYYPKTHVAIGVQDFGAQVLCVSQNSTAAQDGNPYPKWTTGPTTIQHLPRQGLIAIIRPRTGGAIAAQGTITEGELTVAEIDDINKKLAILLDRTKDITTDAGPVSVRQFISDGTRAAQKAAEQTGPINVTGGQEGIRDFIAKGTRAAQSTAAQIAGLQAALSAVIKAGGSPIDLSAVTDAAEAGATKALANLDLTGTITLGGK